MFYDWPSHHISAPRPHVAIDASSVYAGHLANVADKCSGRYFDALKDDSIIVLCHDDIELLSDSQTFLDMLEICNKPGVGFVGVAGATRYDGMSMQGAWWNARNTGESRGFVFQGKDKETMTPNYFGQHGQVVVLDGCFMACSYKTLKAVGLEKPHYLTSDWDFYDIHLTLKAHLMGLSNYTVPIIIRHESDGQMREGWHTARQQFLKYHHGNLPIKLPYQKTNGLPK
jgi:hypothetical protein